MKSESAVDAEVQLEAGKHAVQLLRNNSGVAREVDPKTGRKRIIRYGLDNTSKTHNEQFKSSDYVGTVPIIITPDMVGQLIGIPLYLELKREGWRYTGVGREVAQKRFMDRQALFGAICGFASSVAEFNAVIAPFQHQNKLAVQRLRGCDGNITTRD